MGRPSAGQIGIQLNVQGKLMVLVSTFPVVHEVACNTVRDMPVVMPGTCSLSHISFHTKKVLLRVILTQTELVQATPSFLPQVTSFVIIQFLVEKVLGRCIACPLQ